ncbi:guanylate-binding protein 4-like protein [Chrysochromulina tobinii]|uniref:Guanylate-binding protein 4-like protein n=1 Tax=Chrysochromulina tobinii TaxID=1460289 RepID=A0A0M0JTW8_9EUKA|nr:guanylate-binding protein 4-like protein [Chrysochromulina tobinii]|eukprot:KOO29797.1 guanylate-binding protein 4-like protein [Chrysochromulina sp. CCMP291]
MSLMRHGASTAVFALLTAVLALVATGEPHVPPQQQPLALLLPDKDTHTKLVLQEDALELLRGQLRETPLPVVSVVGAYRTGKSFLLNELMGVGCSEGFVVGHQRHTQTKGVWIWPRRDSNGTVRIFMDTEGFEGTGQADVYDDRIFAFAALISSVLVYNLAETIKQADIERLAFASQLSQEFWHRAQHTARGGRDFLEGGSVEAYLHQALQPSEHLDEHSKRLNKVRDALISFDRMRALGLPQPHVHRTELCALPREQYDPGYLRALVHSNIDRLVESLRALPLPLSEAALQAAFEQRLRAAMERLRDESFGATDATDLEVRARDALRAVADSNFVASQRACDELWGRCEAMLRRGTAAWLPSTARYDAHVLACNRTLEGCVGPAAARFHESLLPQLASEGRTAYRAAYRERLHRAAVALSIVGVLGARFCVRSWLLELVCALGFVLLELLPSLDPLGLSSQLVWGSSRVEHAVDTYERLVFNEYWDLGELLPIGVIASFALYVLRRLVLSRVRRGKHKPEAREQGGGADLAQVVIKGE